MLIPTSKNVKTVTDLREKTLEVLMLAKRQSPTYIFHHNKPKGVLLSMNQYLELLEQIEYYEDCLLASELEGQREEKYYTLSEVARDWGVEDVLENKPRKRRKK